MPGEHFALAGKSFGGYLAQGIFHKRSAQIDGLSLLAPALHKRQRTLPTHVIFEQDEQLLAALDPDIKTAFETLFVYQNKRSLDHFMHEIQPGRLLADRKFLTSDWRTGHMLEIEQRSIVQTHFQEWLDRIESAW